jgi:hypothetical protein
MRAEKPSNTSPCDVSTQMGSVVKSTLALISAGAIAV